MNAKSCRNIGGNGFGLGAVGDFGAQKLNLLLMFNWKTVVEFCTSARL